MTAHSVIAGNRGFALVATLWMVALLTIIAGAFTLGVRREATALSHLQDVTRARYVAEAGVSIAVMALSSRKSEAEADRWQADGTFYESEFYGVPLRVRIIEETAKVDINAADPELLDGLLMAVGVEDEVEREEVVAAIVEWRERGRERNLGDRDASGEGDGPDRPGNLPPVFRIVEELQLVREVTRDLFERLHPFITVYSGQSGINPGTAPPTLLAALGLSPEQVEAFTEERQRAREEGNVAPSVVFEGVDPRLLVQGGTFVYTIESFATLTSGFQAGVGITLQLLSRRGGEPYLLLAYQALGSEQGVAWE